MEPAKPILLHIADAGLARRIRQLLVDDGFAVTSADLPQMSASLAAIPESLLVLSPEPANLAWLSAALTGERMRTVIIATADRISELRWHPDVIDSRDLDQLADRLRAKAGNAGMELATRDPAPVPVRAYLLLVDDDTASSDYLATRLESIGYRCRVATDGMEAIRQIQGAVPDVVLLDLNMPGMDGMTFLRRAQQSIPRAFGVIVITGEQGARLREQVVRYGAFSLLPKPVDFAELLRLIELQLEYRNTQERIRGGG